MNRNTAVAKLAQMAPTDAEIRRVLQTLSSDELRQYVKNQHLALEACDRNDSAVARDAVLRTVRIACAILDGRVCIAQ